MGWYQASKLAAHTATLDYVSSKKPQYSVVTIHPVFVFGHNILQTTADELSGTEACSLAHSTPKSRCSRRTAASTFSTLQKPISELWTWTMRLCLRSYCLERIDLGRMFWTMRGKSSLALASRRSRRQETDGSLIRLAPKRSSILRRGGRWKCRSEMLSRNNFNSVVAKPAYKSRWPRKRMLSLVNGRVTVLMRHCVAVNYIIINYH
jgi:hypothetical protein